MATERVVITAISAITAIGIGVERFYRALSEGQCGLSKISNYDISSFPIKVAGEIKNQDLKSKLAQLNIDESILADRKLTFILLAIHELLPSLLTADQTVDQTVDQEISDIIIGSGIEEFLFEDLRKLLAKEVTFEECLGKSPYLLRTIEDYPSYYLSLLLKNTGIHVSNVAACAASAQAIGMAYQRIKYGYATRVVAGGVDSILNPFGMLGFSRLGALSDSEKCTPFDLKRNGTLLGEGAALLLLESLSSAQRRGATIFAEILGYTSTNDAYNITHPDPNFSAVSYALKQLLTKAKINHWEVDYINAHGTGTPLNDVVETKAIKEVFGDHAYKLKISSIKSMIGHLIAAAGAIEVVATTLSIYKDILFPTINLNNRDPECDLDYLANNAQRSKVNIALSNSFGFGGFNAIIALKKYLP